jgi:hypothetical protein
MVRGALTGRRFGLILVGGIEGEDRYACRCDCGAQTSVAGTNLRNGRTTSCGDHRRHQQMMTQLPGYRAIQRTGFYA